jgi:LPXTG-site transpeptidase (sortase) family protein
LNAFAAYEFESAPEPWAGTATSSDEPIAPDPISENLRRNKDNSALPPPYFYGSGDIPTEPSSLYHDNSRESGFVSGRQQYPADGGEDYAPGISIVTTEFLPQDAPLQTVPLYYEDGSIGTLTNNRTGKSAKVYEGESLENLKLGLGHFAESSAWDGNVALCGHNRTGFFGALKDAEPGDTFSYSTPYGTRTYEVFSKIQVSESDRSILAYSSENILTLVTCVEDARELRLVVRAREIRA